MFEKLMPLYSQFFSSLLTYLLPPTCALCGRSTQRPQSLCVPCQADLPILAENCRKCALFIGATPHSSGYCDECLIEQKPYDRIFALYLYEFPLSPLIQQLKFNRQLYLGQLLGELLIEQIQVDWYAKGDLPDLIIPVPLHPLRLRERGYNQALEIARPIAKRLKIPIDTTGIQRVRHTNKQSNLDKAARAINMQGAFMATRDYNNLKVVIVDDVMTTGSTISELAQVLRKAGAAQIEVWCCARR